MQAYFPLVSKSRSLGRKEQPHTTTPKRPRRTESTLSSSAITRGLLETLPDTLNPITHSSIIERTDHVVSFATGHQVSDGRRDSRLPARREDNKPDADSSILKNTKIYINGYLESTTDIELKRLVLQAGGQIVFSPAQCTHIITSRCLSAPKTDRLLTRKTRSNVYTVKPEWVLDSIAIGKRRPERSYAIVRSSNTLQNFLTS